MSNFSTPNFCKATGTLPAYQNWPGSNLPENRRDRLPVSFQFKGKIIPIMAISFPFKVNRIDQRPPRCLRTADLKGKKLPLVGMIFPLNWKIRQAVSGGSPVDWNRASFDMPEESVRLAELGGREVRHSL